MLIRILIQYSDSLITVFFLLMYVLETDTCTLLRKEHNYVCLEIFILCEVFIYNYKSYVKYEQQTNKANMTHDPFPQKSREKKAIYKKDQLHAQKVLTLQSFCVLSLKIKQESSTVTNDVAWRFLIKFKIHVFKIIMYISLLYSKTCEIRGKRIYIHFINLLDFFQSGNIHGWFGEPLFSERLNDTVWVVIRRASYNQTIRVGIIYADA